MPDADRLAHARTDLTARLRAELTAHLRAAGCVFAEDEADLILAAHLSPTERDALVARRTAGEPLEHLLGWAEFAGHRIAVGPGVFIPRRRTKFLVDLAATLTQPDDIVLDLCCGSGALGLAVAAAVAARDGVRPELHAADIDPIAVACARRNLEPIGAAVYLGDLFDPLPETLHGRIGLVLANVPYVPTAALDAMPGEARDHEPLGTHDGGPDGLDVLRRVLAAAPPWLAPGAQLLVELDADQTVAARTAFAGAGLTTRVEYSDEYETTVVIGTASHG